MFERFTDRARRAVVLAQEEARRLQHSYIGTEHILLGLLGERDGIAARALQRFGLTLDGAREEVAALVGTGTSSVKGHIPFTPRAKKTLELALREALELHHNYIGTEHILLGVIREGEGAGAKVLREHAADLLPVRVAVLDLLQVAGAARGGHWLRRRIRSLAGSGETAELPEEEAGQATTLAAEASLTEAARLAGEQAVGSHHLMLAALSDPNAAAARALRGLGIDLDRAREALRHADVTGTSDELAEDAGRRQMVIRVAEDRLTIEATDPTIVALGQAALDAVGDQAEPPGTIRGDHPASISLSDLWQTLRDSLFDIGRRARASAESEAPAQPEKPEPRKPEPEKPAKPDEPGTGTA
jgi:ATP-dependent Clp protease ATP-binding subunit ClpA